MKFPIQSELAWAAGFFDGEGSTNLSFRTHNGTKYGRVQLRLVQITEGPIRRFQAALGGNLGRVYFYPSKNEKHQDLWTFQASGWKEVQAIIAMLWRYLCSIKQQQAARALSEFHSKWFKQMHEGFQPGYVRGTSPPRYCSVEECNRLHRAKGLCKHHYDRRNRANRKAGASS